MEKTSTVELKAEWIIEEFYQELKRRQRYMAKQLKKRPIERELKYLADFEIYGVLMFVGLYFAAKFIVDMDCGKNAFKLN